MPTMLPLQTLAVAKVVKDRVITAARAKCRAGDHSIDVTVRVHGTLTIGNGYTQQITGVVPWEALAKLAIDKLSPQSVALIVEQVHEAQAAGTVSTLVEEVDDSLKETTAALFETFKAATEKDCAGKVNTNLVVERV